MPGFGRGGIMEDVSNRLLREFAACLASRLGEPAAAEEPAATAASTPPPPAPPAAPVKGFSLVFSVLWERVRRLFGRGPS